MVYLNDIRETAKLLIEDVESVEAQLDEVKSPAMFEKRIDHLALSQKNLVTRPDSKSHSSASAAWNEPLVTTPPPISKKDARHLIGYRNILSSRMF